MNIVHINTWHKGGAAAAAQRLCLAQRKRGWNANVLVAAHNNVHECVHSFEDFVQRKKGKLRTQLLFKAHKVYNQIPTRFDTTVFFNRPQSLLNIHEHPLVQSADLIHLHGVAKFLDYPSFFTAVQTPIVWTLHDMNPFSGGKHYDTGFKTSLAALEQQYIQVKKKAIGNRPLHIVSPSSWLCSESKKSELFGQQSNYCIPNCIDTDIFKYHTRTEHSHPKILFVAENVNDQRKGFHYLLDALPHLSSDIELLILGNANPNLFPKNANINYLGYVSDPHKMASIYAESDVFVIPSLEDNLPNTIVESHCCGTPVVGFKTTGIAGMIAHQQNGILVNDFKGEALAKGIASALALHQQQINLRQNISAQAIATYNETTVVDAYEVVYQNAIQ